MDYRVDTNRLVPFDPPIFFDKSKVVRVYFDDKEKFFYTLGRKRINIDVWAVQDNSLDGSSTYTNIKKIQSSGFKVDVRYESLNDYFNDIDTP